PTGAAGAPPRLLGRRQTSFFSEERTHSRMPEQPSLHNLTSVETQSPGKPIRSTTRAHRWAFVAAILVLALIALASGWVLRQTRLNTPDPRAFWEQAQRDLQHGHYADVERALNQASRFRSPTPQDWFLRAELANVRDQPEEALANLARIPDRHPLGAHARM